MMNQSGDYITEEKRTALLAELKDLKGPKRREILDTLEYAKSLGDLSENAEYHQAREDQGKLEERIAKIEKIHEERYSKLYKRSCARRARFFFLHGYRRANTPNCSLNPSAF